ncbi:MAG: hypothetical protein PUG96_04615 [Prevotellaceae bacterium]|nr:hypothetical protein [Prevotellaceae bacterium]
MKKTFLFLVAVCTLCACSNQEDLVNYDENQNSSKLITLSSQDKESVKSLQFEVAEYNKGIGLNYYQQTPQLGYNKIKKGWWRRLWQSVATVFSDAVGGMIGGLPGGVITSGLVGSYVFGNDTDFGFKFSFKNSKDTDYSLISRIGSRNFDIDTVKISKIGELHNGILYPIFSDSVEFEKFLDLTTDAKTDFILENLEIKCQDKDLAVYNKEDIKRCVKLSEDLSNTIETSSSIEEFCTKIKANKSLDEDIVNLLVEYISGLSNTYSEQDINKYVEDIIKLIDKSNLSIEVKNAIKNSINIGVASDQLWNRELVLKKIND